MDIRGELLQEFASGLGLSCENIGSTPTFQAGIGKSVIDFTLSRLTGGQAVGDWRVDDGVYTGPDHNCIVFKVQDGRFDHLPAISSTRNGWSLQKLDIVKLVAYIREKRPKETASG